MIRLKPDELETVAKHIPDAEDACQRARTTLSWEPSSLAMDLPGVSTPAIEALRDELIHWLRRYEEKLNEAEELLYRTAAAMRQADETLADNMKEFGLELLGWYDVQRVFGEYDPITGERLSIGDRLLAGGMLLLSIVPPAKSAGVAGKAAIKGAKALDTASTLSKVKHVVRDDKMKAIGDIAFRQTVRSPLAETARLFKKQWDELVESVASVSWQPAYAGVGPSPRVWMSEAKDASLNMIKKVEGEVVEKGIGKLDSVPSVKNGEFNKWFNSLTPDELDEVWSDPKLRKAIESRLRHPGGFHEWHLVSRAPIFKRWGITAEQIKELRTAIEDVKFVNPKGIHGGKGSTKAHNELLEIIDTSLDYATFKRRLQNWAHYRLEGGVDALPEGLRP
ncbi:pre-toxin TG domain-containing protein [Geobacillus icigianus]|uniref:Pre-toxin TG domain-containing protein n=1 Tax=Geobacillus icigianus TaxID=1430331 RepID=A0ABU6BGW7_9BACL|nr:pre-toxin TG domain-containing protein [Geobacillus icigianus]MEB3751149.1 hypothetical protein [Geobacillus icigianus]